MGPRGGKQPHHSSLLLVDWAIRENLFCSLVDALVSALASAVSDEFGDAFEKFRQHSDYLYEIAECLRSEHEGDLSESEVHGWFRQFCKELEVAEPQLYAEIDDEERLEEAFAEAFEEIRCAGRRSIVHDPLELGVGDFEAAVAIAAGIYGRQVLLLAPLYFIALLPFEPLDSWAEIHPLVYTAVDGSPEGLSIGEIALYLQDHGLDASHGFIQAVAAWDARLIAATRPTNRVCGIRRVIPQVGLLCHSISRRQYVRMDGPYSFVGPDGRLTHRYGWPHIDVAAARRQFVDLSALIERYGIDWTEVAAKIALASLEPPALEQGMPQELHQEIVKRLLKLERSVSADELERQLGFQLPFSPETLPPGRIMAYARHPRFLRPDQAIYVLRDWVETATEKRGRILRDRIVTPFDHKEVHFDIGLVERVLEGEPLYRMFGLASLSETANLIAQKLPGRPIELYFRHLIKKRLENLLSSDFIDIGLDMVARAGSIPARRSGDGMHEWRVAIVNHVLHHPRDAAEAIARISERAVRASLFRLLRQKDPAETA